MPTLIIQFDVMLYEAQQMILLVLMKIKAIFQGG